MSKTIPYDIIVRPLTKEEGGGYIAYFPDLPGCQADGETPEQAILQAQDALTSWLKTAKEFGDRIPKPKQQYSGQWRTRVSKSLHADLALRAKYEGVSLNMLVASILSDSMGHYHEHKKDNKGRLT
jgi:antitoxin HicB